MSRNASVYVIFFLSGTAGLGYEIVWTRMFTTGLGHEMPSLLAVVAAFFGGLAVGAWLLDGVVSRSKTPGRWYALLEAAIGIWALASIALIPVLNDQATVLMGVSPSPVRQWAVAFGIPFLALLPATAAMGASFPAMERLASRLRGNARTIGGLYACNTAGAVAGIALTTFVAAPALGFRLTLLFMAALNFTCAVATWFGPAAGEEERPAVATAMVDPPSRARLAGLLFGTGLLGIGYEVLGVRTLAQVYQNTVYTFATTLSVFLLGTAIGASLYQRFAKKEAFVAPIRQLLQLLAIGCLLGIVLMPASGHVYSAVRVAFGGGTTASIFAEATVALTVFLLPTVVMGATFSHLAQAARGASGGVGWGMAWNTLGSSLAPLVFAVSVLPWTGLLWALVACSVGYLVLIPLCGLSSRRLVPLIPVGVILIFALQTDLLLVDVPAGSRVVDHREGVRATVVVLDQGHGRTLKVNNRFSMGGTAHSFVDRRQAHIPLLLHPKPERALFLGVGSGVTAGAATNHRGLEFRGVELLSESLELIEHFQPGNQLERIDVDRQYALADARRYVRATEESYDVIVADLFHPARDGAGALYTREHFEAVRERMRPGGLFCQWLPLYQLDVEMVRLVVRTFLRVFPETNAYLGHFNVNTPMIGLVGGVEPRRFEADWYAKRVTHRPLVTELTELAMGNGSTLFGCLFATRSSLVDFAGDGPLNTDDHPVVMFRAPDLVYREEESGRRQLRDLLDVMKAPAAEVVQDDGSSAAAEMIERLDDYIAARDLYLRAGIASVEGRREKSMEWLKQSVAKSADFTTAYVMCLQEAANRVESDRAAAEQLLRFLVRARPEDPRAGQYLRQYFRR